MVKVINFAAFRATVSAKNGAAVITTTEDRLLSHLADEIAFAGDGVKVTQICRRGKGTNREPVGLIGIDYEVSEEQLIVDICDAIATVYDVTPVIARSAHTPPRDLT